MQILIAAPADYATGGVELLHQLCFELNKTEDVDARIWYRNAGAQCPQPDDYRRYGCQWVTDLPEGYDGVLIFPEIWANDVVGERFRKCQKVIFWESVDNYFAHNAPKDYYKFIHHQLIERDVIMHIAQSVYACEFLKQINLKCIMLGDYINDDFFKSCQETARDPVVLYNPKKGMQFTQKLIDFAGDSITFIPIENMDRKQVIALMRRSMLYIDFGNHPGRERLPREAAVCGCCVITGRDGSAENSVDIPISNKYKFARSDQQLPFIVDRIRSVLWDYERCKKDFDFYRYVIADSKRVFEDQCRRFVSGLRAAVEWMDRK